MTTILDAGETPAKVATDLRPVFEAWRAAQERGEDVPTVELRSVTWPYRLLVLSPVDLELVAGGRSAGGRS